MEQIDYKTPLIIAIGEGDSDESYLNLPLNAFFHDKYGARCKIIHISDVTGDPFLTEEEFEKLFPSFVENSLKDPKNKIDSNVAKNIKEIVHIIDIDEAFIGDELIHEDASKNSFHYERDGIYYKVPDLVKERNERKRYRILYLLEQTTINIFELDIPYSLYFYSVNIDDFHQENALNWDQDRKNKEAALFERKYFAKSEQGRIKLFLSLFEKTNPSDFPNGLLKSWQYISENNNSLKRCSNAFLIIKPKER